MGFLDYGQGAQAFMDNLLKTKLGLEEGYRQQAEAARRQEMFLQKQREQQEYAELMSKINSPAMAEVKNPNAFNVVSNNKPVPNDFLNFVQTGQNPQGFLQPQDNNPTIQKQFPSQVEAWQAQKLDPEKEIFNRSLAIQTKYDPTEAIKTRASLIRTDENNDTKMAMFEERMRQNIEMLKMRGDMQSQLQADRLQNTLDAIRLRASTPNVNVHFGGSGNGIGGNTYKDILGQKKEADKNRVNLLKEYNEFSGNPGAKQLIEQQLKDNANELDYLNAKLRGGKEIPKASEAMPDAAKYKGKVIKDTVTGERLKSDGLKWVKQ